MSGDADGDGEQLVVAGELADLGDAVGGELDVDPMHDAVAVDEELSLELGPLALDVAAVGVVALVAVGSTSATCRRRSRC